MSNKKTLLLLSLLIFVGIFTLLVLGGNGKNFSEEIGYQPQRKVSKIDIERIKSEINGMDQDEIDATIVEIEKEIDYLRKKLENY